MVVLQASPTAWPTLPSGSRGNGTAVNGNGTIVAANSTSIGGNITTTMPTPPPSLAPTVSQNSSSGGSSSPIRGKLGAGLGAALGFAAVVILVVLWHVCKAQRKRRQQRWLQDEYATRIEDRGGGYQGEIVESHQQRSTEQLYRQHQIRMGTTSTSSTSLAGALLPDPQTGKEKEQTTTKTVLMPRDAPKAYDAPINGQTETSSPKRGRGRRRGERLLGGSRERRDGLQRMDMSTEEDRAPTAADRSKFSFEGVAQSEDSIETLSQIRLLSLADVGREDPGGQGAERVSEKLREKDMYMR
ncbi:uncharacterized protein SPSK_01225 [Sporothrix schenckii 1099-18]|uniref:Uncharacterized protein n=1 Tax=Sporothrix schenckii 1099-18 TaxID=1397361 RepID=A0A0F2LUS9_SPOSC|nr:uncharacterized protein SPSK_01225 [Sporothrix schenckii 1099-18]KJR81222.1 hypothetical protein SPSK_01225 [Sporothrix schenckii 1099-18]